LERLFAHLPREAGAVYVVALRQKDGIDPERVVEVAGRQSGLAAEIVVDGAELVADRIYVTPTRALTVVEDGRLRVSPADAPAGERGSIDSLLVSLAEAAGSRAIGVVLRDLAGDGVAGVTALKDLGGLTLVEQDDLAAPELASAVHPANLADFVVPVEQIAERIVSYCRHRARLIEESAEALDEALRSHLSAVATILRNRTGHDFHGYKQNTFLRRIQRRMQVLQIEDIDRYVHHLGANADEVGHLFQDLLIGVTQFFRDKAEFGLLEREVVPKLFAGKTALDQVRVWVLGCATGEEAYSIAMLLREHMASLDVVPHVQIFATDLDGRALTMARAGRYPEAIAKDVTPERLARWFVHEGATYSVVKELREMCIFSQHNVIKDAPFSRTDLVSCRNLLIYLTSELQDRVIPLFHFSLRPNGFLFLGPSENITRHAKLFGPLDRKLRIFKRLETPVRILPEFPLSAGERMRGAERPASRARPRPDAIGRRAEQIAERYAPAHVVIDEQYEVLHFSGRTGRYLEPVAGAASLNLLNLVRRELRVELRGALHAAAEQKQAVKLDRLHVDIDGERHRVDMVVEPIREEGSLSFVVLFRDGGPSGSLEDVEETSAALLRDEHVQGLEGELRLIKERLQATIEELESTNEELKSSNEEYQSINEELQSANEELETSKEELQSVNEELHTVNGELAHRVNELARTNSDLKNLLESTQIATLFVDNELRVKSFTPTAADVFHVLDSDVGRPIGHIGSRVIYPEMESDIRKVLRTLGMIEREVQSSDGTVRFMTRVLPYRSVDNFIAGAVMTFADITEIVEAQAALRESETRYRLIVESATDYAIIALDPERKIVGWNPGAANIFGWTASEMVGQSGDQLFTPDDRAAGEPEKEALLAKRDGRGADLRWHVRRDGSRFWGSGVMMPLRGEAGGFVKILHDRTDERDADERQKLMMAELQHRVKNILAVVRSIASRTQETSADLETFVAHFDGRLSALSRTQSVLARNSVGRVDLEELVRDELLSHGAHDDHQIQVGGPQVLLPDRTAEIFALALHELATNAVKYGALSSPKGRVTVSWRIFNTSSGPRLSLEWRESGVAAIDANPRRRGFGRELLEQGLPYELGAATSLEFLPGGVRCVIEAPAPENEADVAVAE
jgi:two-component system CheB/CheR fusion protein